jgi:hypothetical protein
MRSPENVIASQPAVGHVKRKGGWLLLAVVLGVCSSDRTAPLDPGVLRVAGTYATAVAERHPRVADTLGDTPPSAPLSAT